MLRKVKLSSFAVGRSGDGAADDDDNEDVKSVFVDTY